MSSDGRTTVLSFILLLFFRSRDCVLPSVARIMRGWGSVGCVVSAVSAVVVVVVVVGWDTE